LEDLTTELFDRFRGDRLLQGARLNNVHADLALKERALARTTPIATAPGRYQPTDTIMAILDNQSQPSPVFRSLHPADRHSIRSVMPTKHLAARRNHQAKRSRSRR
jgi:hypothetical protein